MTQVKQVSIFLENKKGRLLDALKALAKAKINIRALSVADTADYGILRMIVSDVPRSKAALEASGFTVKETEVIAIGVNDQPGGLAKILEVLNNAGLNVEYVYAFAEKHENDAIVVLRTENIELGIKTLTNAKVKILEAKKVYSI
ncbi:MAG: acetolactate synthase [Candidatus Firestonebacteria bacterium RIFOXYA2_FULL_40_8]|nr:MAG: acetolactate synthase [Candidatus Firestonebacteria bacterium RIFOXYA2_FULL_40_8]